MIGSVNNQHQCQICKTMVVSNDLIELTEIFLYEASDPVLFHDWHERRSRQQILDCAIIEK